MLCGGGNYSGPDGPGGPPFICPSTVFCAGTLGFGGRRPSPRGGVGGRRTTRGSAGRGGRRSRWPSLRGCLRGMRWKVADLDVVPWSKLSVVGVVAPMGVVVLVAWEVPPLAAFVVP